MNEQLQQFADEARSKGMHKGEVVELLTEAGWSRAEAATAVYGLTLSVPKPLHQPAFSAPVSAGLKAPRASNDPIAVVQNLSTRGFEYSIMFVSLWASALSLGVILHEFVNSAFYSAPASDLGYSYDTPSSYSFPAVVLLVTLPIFVFLFLRLKRAELADPELRRDPSRKRLSHLTQFLTFLTGIGYIVHFLYTLSSGTTGRDGAQSITELCLQLLITLVIAGGIFAYYWIDEHRAERV